MNGLLTNMPQRAQENRKPILGGVLDNCYPPTPLETR
jgi:hypothetical protein